MGARMVMLFDVTTTYIMFSIIYQIAALTIFSYYIFVRKKYLIDPIHKYSLIACLIGDFLAFFSFLLILWNFIDSEGFLHLLMGTTFIWLLATFLGIRLESLLKKIYIISAIILSIVAFGKYILTIEIPLTLFMTEIIISIIFISLSTVLSLFAGIVAQRFALIGNSIFQVIFLISSIFLIWGNFQYYVLTYTIASTFLIGGYIFFAKPKINVIKIATLIGFFIQFITASMLFLIDTIDFVWGKAFGSIVVIPITIFLLIKAISISKESKEKVWNYLSWIFLGFLLYAFSNNALTIANLTNPLSIIILNAFETLSFVIISSNVVLFSLNRLLKQFSDKQAKWVKTISSTFDLLWKILGGILLVVIPLELEFMIFLDFLLKIYVLVTITFALSIFLFHAYTHNVKVYAYYAYASFFLLSLFLLFYYQMLDITIQILEISAIMILIHVSACFAVIQDVNSKI